MEALAVFSILTLLYFVAHYGRTIDTSVAFNHMKPARITTRLTDRIAILNKRRARVYRLYLEMVKERNQYKASQALLIIKRIDNEMCNYNYTNLFQFN